MGVLGRDPCQLPDGPKGAWAVAPSLAERPAPSLGMLDKSSRRPTALGDRTRWGAHSRAAPRSHGRLGRRFPRSHSAFQLCFDRRRISLPSMCALRLEEAGGRSVVLCKPLSGRSVWPSFAAPRCCHGRVCDDRLASANAGIRGGEQSGRYRVTDETGVGLQRHSPSHDEQVVELGRAVGPQDIGGVGDGDIRPEMAGVG